MQWEEASFVPAGVSGLRDYRVYSTLLLDGEGLDEEWTNPGVMINPSKVLQRCAQRS